MTSPPTVLLDGTSLTLDSAVAVARRGAKVALGPGAAERIEQSFQLNQALLRSGKPIYGVTTGVGDSVGRQVGMDRAALLQEALIRLNGCGTGPILPREQARAVVLARANCLARGCSAVRPVLVERILDMLNHELLPLIPEQGSVGASGDLIPSSYIGAALMGERPVTFGGKMMPAAEAWAALGKQPLRLEAKEGLAVLNGTCFMTGLAVLVVEGAERIARLADLCTALTCEALTGISGPFHPFIHSVKPHPGQVRSAGRIRQLLEGSALVRPYAKALEGINAMGTIGVRQLGVRIQENYSIRCAPQCIGALYDAVAWARGWVETELNSANDNPLYDVQGGELHSGGNFSGFHMALAMDTLKTAVASVVDLLDRQFELMVDERYSQGLPANLTARLPEGDPEEGIFHGFKAMQINLSALTAEALGKCMPMTVFSRSTECHNQDKVSMGAIAARQARDVVELAERALSIHLLGACQAADLRGADKLGGARKAYERIRAVSPFVERDRELQQDIYSVAELLRADALEA
jgi:histidine ammonia-lyase/phenylalanine ammonia-lyase